MTDPGFGAKDFLELTDYQGKTIFLYKKTWELKIKYPERNWIEHNFDKIKQTVLDPDEIRQSSKSQNSKILYRRFESIKIRANVEVPFESNYFAIVIKQDRYIQTFYPCKTIKGGKVIWYRPKK